jgi:hypothetical protein
MRDYFAEIFEADGFGDDDDEVVLRSGERMRVPLPFMDARRFDDGVVRDAAGVVAGHRPGFLFSPSVDRRAAEEAWQNRGAQLRDAWRGPGTPSVTETPVPACMTLDQARAAAEAAWERRGERLSNAWRGTR